MTARRPSAVRAARDEGLKVGLLRPITLMPFPNKRLDEIAQSAKSILVVEMNMGQVMTAVKQAVDHPERVFLANRIDGVFITPEDIMRILRIIQGRGV